MISKIVNTTAAFVLMAQTVLAGQPKPTELFPIDHANAALVVVDAQNNETVYTPADLEKFSTYSMSTTTPWRDEPAEFAGVMLSDILIAHGLDDAETIVVTAENDYSTTLSRELIENVEILVATRVNGRAHSRRERGPIQFVIDASVFESSNLTSESNLVWMASRIEAAK